MTLDPATLEDGTRIGIRPVRPEDRDLLAAGFERLSPESRYRRFFAPVNELTERQLDYLTRVDHHDHEALLAVHHESGELLGVARYVRTGAGHAEPAVVVADDWQGRGVATILLGRLVERALDEGIASFEAPVLAGNAEAIEVLRRLGETTLERRGTEVEVRVALAPPAEPISPLRGILRALAGGMVEPALTFWHRLLPRSPAAERTAADDERANVLVTAVEAGGGEDRPATALARRLATASGATVVLVAARTPLLDDRDGVEQHARRLAGRLRADGIDVREEVRAGDLAAVVLDVATEERARLIIVDDPPGAGPAGRLLGEPWDHISHHAPCSVLVAR